MLNMFLQSLSLINFKNYKSAGLSFSPKINCFVGNNGVGKTNLLDAVYYLSFCKSYFDQVDSHNINYDESFFVIQGVYERADAIENIYCGIKRNQRKQFKRNRIEYDKLSDHIGFIPLVMISPSDNNLISEGSEDRRKFINSIISQFDKEYLDNLIKYNRALQQRNILLKNFAAGLPHDRETIELWDEQLISYGTLIMQKRKEFVDQFVPVFKHYYKFISNNKEEVKLGYISQLLHAGFRQLLENSLQKDIVLQYTSQGIHKDDLDLLISGRAIKLTGSQGQQKTFLVALKLAQFDFIREYNGFKPILLLDDIFDKLDRIRVKQIMNLVAENNFGQIFITDTNPVRLNEILSGIPIKSKIYNIMDDKIEELQNGNQE